MFLTVLLLFITYVYHICICIYLAMLISYYVCLKYRGRVVINVVRICDPTPLLYIFGNNFTLIGRLDMLLSNRESLAQFEIRIKARV